MNKLFIPVSVEERLPAKSEWYNLYTNMNPSPCGRAYFDGSKFKFTSSSATKGILESGNKLYWLEAVDKAEYDRRIAEKAWDAGQKRLKHEYPDYSRDAFNWMLDEKLTPNKEQYLKSLNKTGE